MNHISVIAVNFAASATPAWERMVEAVMAGVRSAGALTHGCISCRDVPEDAVPSLLARISNASHAVLGGTGEIDFEGSPYARLVTACVACAWGPEAVRAQCSHASPILASTSRVAASERRAVIVVDRPEAAMQRFDPCANAFAVLDETARWLGFAPIERILCTEEIWESRAGDASVTERAHEVGRRLILSPANL